MINRIAKRIYLSFLKTKNYLINKQVEYAHKLFNQFDVFFTSDLLNTNFVKKTITVDLSILSDKFDNQTIEVTVIMLYVEEVDKKDYIKHIMKPEYTGGMGEALDYNGEHYIVIYGSTDRKDHCYYKKYFQETFTHELMHIIDKIIDENYYKDFYFGHPVDGFKDNEGIPYPGMYGDDDDLLDENFAEYYTCMAERKEYIHDLICTIEDFIEKNNFELKKFVSYLIKLLDNKQKFIKLTKLFKKQNLNYSPLAFIYHLTFSKQKNGNKQDAIKILKELL